MKNVLRCIVLSCLAVNAAAHECQSSCDKDDTPFLDGEIRFGGIVNSGNTDNKHIDGAIELMYKKDPWKWNGEFGAQWTQTDQETKARRYDLNLDAQRKRKAFDFFVGEYRGTWNPFATFDMTQTLIGGYGATVYKSEAAELEFQGGLGLRSNRTSGSRESTHEGLGHVEADYTYQFNDATSFKQTVNIDSGHFNTVSKTNSLVRTKMIRNVSLEVSYNTLRNSKIPENSKNKKKLDTSTKINIVYEFM